MPGSKGTLVLGLMAREGAITLEHMAEPQASGSPSFE